MKKTNSSCTKEISLLHPKKRFLKAKYATKTMRSDEIVELFTLYHVTYFVFLIQFIKGLKTDIQNTTI